MLQNFLKICFTFAFFSFASAETYTFTNAGATGQNGPTQTQITSSYSGSNLAGNVTINTQGIQEWTVPFSGEYEIEAKGASGGSSSSNSRLGGKGASIKGTFSLIQNSTLKILVGQQGMEGTHSNKDYGGGGGSFVIQSPYNNNGSILIIAGGGGGAAGSLSTSGDLMGSDAATSAGGTSGVGSNGGSGGSNGAGGQVSTGNAGSGGGFLSNGNGNIANAQGKGFVNGGVGGQNQTASGIGGFGGGGGGWHYGGHGGGGGGYSGGGTGGSGYYGGGGGGSFNAGTNQSNSSGINTGNGVVTITLITPGPFEFNNAGNTGRSGPTQTQIDSSYSGTTLAGKVTVTQGIQAWTVPLSGNYKIEAWGAKGGGSNGGKGAKISGNFTLTANETINIIVGQKGTVTNQGSSFGAGGGGGTYVYRSLQNLLIAAGGGGGQAQNSLGGGGSSTETTTNSTGTQGNGAGGSGGNGGSGGLDIDRFSTGGGGGGWSSNGADGLDIRNDPGKGGLSPANGSIGGEYTHSTASYHSGDGGDGGFGGGGGMSDNSGAGGGGGGYNGGGGGNNYTSSSKWGGGGGAGSFNSGTSQNNIADSNTDHGKVIITFINISSSTATISPGDFEWASHAGGADRAEGYSVDVFEDGSSLIGGMFFGTANFGNSISLTRTNDADGFIAKLNTEGNFTWATKVGCTSSARVSDVAALPDGSSIITGLWKGTATFGSTSLTSSPANYNDFFVAKLDTNGNFLWVTQGGGSSSDESAGISTFSDGSSVVTGQFSGTATFGNTTLTSTNHMREIFVAKLDPNGTFLWAKKAGGSGHDHGRSITTLSDGGIVITGDYASTATFGSVTLNEFGGSSAYIAKLDTNGTFVWAKNAGEDQCCSSINVYAYGVDASHNGSTIVTTGSFQGTSTFGNIDLTSTGSSDAFVAKLDSSGNYLWVTRVGGSSNDIGQSIAMLSDGSSLVTGQFQGSVNFGNTTLISEGSSDIFIANVDENGSFLWATKAGGTQADYPKKIAANNNNKSVLAGVFNQTASFGNTDLTSLGSLEAFAASIKASNNQPPVISQGLGPLTKIITEDTVASWSASELNATDPETNVSMLSWSVQQSPTNGTATVDGNGSSPATFIYLPNSNYFGADSFVVQVSDGELIDSITINLTINPLDDLAVISGDFNSTGTEDSTLSGDINATDADGLTDGSYFSVSVQPANGSASVHPVDGNWSYLPNPNFFGSDSFTLSITDDLNQSYSQIISLSITPVDDVAVISGDLNATGIEDSTVHGDLNATDADGLTDGSYFSVSLQPANGAASINPVDGNWSYLPNLNFFGSDSFTLSITDDLNQSYSQIISLSIIPVDDVAVISGDLNATGIEDSTVHGDLNATDADGLTDGSYFSVSLQPANGAAFINPVDGNWSYLPNLNFFGSDSFTLSITDDLNQSYSQIISLSITPVDDVAVISGDLNATGTEDSTIFGDLNATDADGLTDGSYFSVSVQPANGVSSVHPVDGNWSYLPSPNFFGTDSFTLTVTDDLNQSYSQIISLFITAVDDVAVISGDFNATGTEDSTISGDLNATDADGLTDGLYFSVSVQPANGSVSVHPVGGNWSYLPNPNFFGTDSFSLSVTDDLNQSYYQEISLFITAVDDPAVISGDFNVTGTEDSTIFGDLNAIDADGLTDGSIFSVSLQPANGYASVHPVDGNWSYIPHPNFFGIDSFSLNITDDLNQSYSQVISLSISPVNDPAVISGDFNATGTEDSPISGDLNATDPDGLADGSVFSISVQPTNGYASVHPVDGNWTYLPKPNFFGFDSFTLSVTDDFNQSFSQIISLSISPVNDPTLITGDLNTSIYQGITTHGRIKAMDEDGLSNLSIFSIYQPSSKGAIRIDSLDGNWSYYPNNELFGHDSFIVAVTDRGGRITKQAVTLRAQVNNPTIRTKEPQIINSNSVLLRGEIISKGGNIITEVGFIMSSNALFESPRRIVTGIDFNSSQFLFDANITISDELFYLKAYAKTVDGEFHGETVRINPIIATQIWSKHTTPLEAGWMHSEWFGNFLPFTEHWIFHEQLGWLYVDNFSNEDLWVWTEKNKWLWTSALNFPFMYSNKFSDWLYLLPGSVEGLKFYNYSTDQLE
jgi:hypothetical protein